MAVNTTIEELTEAQVAEIEDTLVELLLERYPSLDLGRGTVLRDILVRIASVLRSLSVEDMDRLRRSMSLAEVEAAPELADEDTVDNILSNYRLTRFAGLATTGRVTLVLEQKITTTIASGTSFTSPSGEAFIAQQAFNAVTDEGLVISPTDRLLRERGDGRFSFTIEVAAAEVGFSTIRQDTRFVVEPEPPRLFDAYAEEDFTPGRDEETNADLVARLKVGITAQSAGGRVNIESMIESHFPSVFDTSVIGFGDAEMVRDRHNIFAISQGGKADIYVRTAGVPLLASLLKTATLVSKADKTWRISIGRDEAPAFYRVETIIRSDQVGTALGTLEIVSDVRGVDTTGDAYVPQLEAAIEGVYTRYQTATIVFKDEQTPVDDLTEGSSTQEYTVTVSRMPEIENIQDLLASRSNRNPQGDYLVRAPIPCFVACEIKIDRHPDDPEVDVAAVVTAAANRVNALLFERGRVPVSEIVDAVEGVLPPLSSIDLPVHLFATARKPDGTSTVNHATDNLVPPVDVEQSVSGRTVAFFLREEDVDVAVTTIDVLDV